MNNNYILPSIDLLDREDNNDSNSNVTFKTATIHIPKEYMYNKLCLPLGVDNDGNTCYFDLSKCNNVLIGGATGSGKSVFLNSIICSILMRSFPSEVRLLLIDTKKLEFSNYNGIPHLITPSISSPREASIGLYKIVKEIEERCDILSQNNAKDIEEFNKTTDIKMPYIVVIVDELFDIMSFYQNEIEDVFRYITENGKKVGIHMIISTQKPSSKLIDILNAKNDLTRISFVATLRDLSGTIGMKVNEKPSAKGGMLFRPFGTDEVRKIKGPYISEEEILRLVDFCILQGKN